MFVPWFLLQFPFVSDFAEKTDQAYRGQSSGLELADFKKGLKELNPYAVYNRSGLPTKTRGASFTHHKVGALNMANELKPKSQSW